jgi:hypothetical protein
MTTLKSFVERLDKIGIKVGLVGNYPWVYLDTVDTVNCKKVKGKYGGNHGFTLCLLGCNNKIHWSGRKIILKKKN